MVALVLAGAYTTNVNSFSLFCRNRKSFVFPQIQFSSFFCSTMWWCQLPLPVVLSLTMKSTFPNFFVRYIGMYANVNHSKGSGRKFWQLCPLTDQHPSSTFSFRAHTLVLLFFPNVTRLLHFSITVLRGTANEEPPTRSPWIARLLRRDAIS